MVNADYEARYTQILREELQVALGCTEPVALAFAAAHARQLLGAMPEHIEIFCSGNIIKNVKAVTVPATNGRRGIEAAALIGMVAGAPEKRMELLTHVTEKERKQFEEVYKKGIVKVSLLETEHVLHVIVKAYLKADMVSVEIIDSHTRLGQVIKNGEILHEREAVKEERISREFMNIRDIVEYADTVSIGRVEEILENQIICNTAIAEEGLKNGWGADIGKIVADGMKASRSRLCAAAAAGSDARMNGCALPVVINSGSGNQGITSSVPVILYAREKKIPKERLIRALCVSNLVTIHQKTGIGKLSAFCGAVSAAAGAVCGIAYLDGEPISVLEEIVSNTISTSGGILCDGAKSSCAAKIAVALYSAFLGYEVAKNETSFPAGEGIVQSDVEKTIAGIGRIAALGMRSTDKEILNIMLQQ